MIKKLFKLQQGGLRLFFMAYVGEKLQMLAIYTYDIPKISTQYAYGINVHKSRYPRLYKADELDKLKSDFSNMSAKIVYLDIKKNTWTAVK